jgi:hypothetical protein
MLLHFPSSLQTIYLVHVLLASSQREAQKAPWMPPKPKRCRTFHVVQPNL